MKGFVRDLDELVNGLYDLRKLIANLKPEGDGSGITPPPLPASSTGGEGIVTVVEAFITPAPSYCCGTDSGTYSGYPECEGAFCAVMVDTNGDGDSDLGDYLNALSAWWDGLSVTGGCTLDKSEVEAKCDALLTLVAKILRWKFRGGRKGATAPDDGGGPD